MDEIYKEKYEKAKIEYLKGDKSITSICKEFKMDRGTFSKNLKKDGVEVINKQNICAFNENFFETINTEGKAYWLGFFYADGYVSKNSNQVELSLKSDDIEHLKKLVNSLNFTKEKHLIQDNIRCRFLVNNKKFKENLVKQGCVPQKSLILTFPLEHQVPKYLIKHFVRGYIDGDGSVMIGLNHKKERVKPRLSVLGTKDFLISLANAMNWKINKISPIGNVYSIEWGGQYVFNYIESLYKDANIYLDRKYEKYLILKNCRL